MNIGDEQRVYGCIPMFTSNLRILYLKMPFYITKRHLLHLKRAPLTIQKGIFYCVKDHLLFSTYESLLQHY